MNYERIFLRSPTFHLVDFVASLPDTEKPVALLSAAANIDEKLLRGILKPPRKIGRNRNDRRSRSITWIIDADDRSQGFLSCLFEREKRRRKKKKGSGRR